MLLPSSMGIYSVKEAFVSKLISLWLYPLRSLPSPSAVFVFRKKFFGTTCEHALIGWICIKYYVCQSRNLRCLQPLPYKIVCFFVACHIQRYYNEIWFGKIPVTGINISGNICFHTNRKHVAAINLVAATANSWKRKHMPSIIWLKVKRFVWWEKKRPTMGIAQIQFYTFWTL